jgi:hypothetical protein
MELDPVQEERKRLQVQYGSHEPAMLYLALLGCTVRFRKKKSTLSHLTLRLLSMRAQSESCQASVIPESHQHQSNLRHILIIDRTKDSKKLFLAWLPRLCCGYSLVPFLALIPLLPPFSLHCIPRIPPTCPHLNTFSQCHQEYLISPTPN